MTELKEFLGALKARVESEMAKMSRGVLMVFKEVDEADRRSPTTLQGIASVAAEEILKSDRFLNVITEMDVTLGPGGTDLAFQKADLMFSDLESNILIVELKYMSLTYCREKSIPTENKDERIDRLAAEIDQASDDKLLRLQFGFPVAEDVFLRKFSTVSNFIDHIFTFPGEKNRTNICQYFAVAPKKPIAPCVLPGQGVRYPQAVLDKFGVPPIFAVMIGIARRLVKVIKGDGTGINGAASDSAEGSDDADMGGGDDGDGSALGDGSDDASQ